VEPLIFIAITIGLVWLLVIRPQRKRAAQMGALIAGLRVGDEIVTAGGMYGTITRMDEEVLTVEIAPGTTVRIARGAVTGVITPRDEADDEQEEEETGQPIAADDR
jgi:preprotein translocase subunit YajC